MKEMVELAELVGSNRSWTKMLSSLPPHSCAPLASDDHVLVTITVHNMRDEWGRWQFREARAADGDAAYIALFHDLYFAKKKCVRLIFMLFEKSNWDPLCIAGQRYVRALLMGPPDNKILEDVHNYLRDG